MRKLYLVNLSEQERSRLHSLLRGGKLAVRTLHRAHVLLLADEGRTDAEIAQALHIGDSTVERTRKRFVLGGLDEALYEKPRLGAAPKFDDKQQAHLIALACSDPPEGRARWTVRLLASRLVELGVTDSISRESVRRTLKKLPQAVAKTAVVYS